MEDASKVAEEHRLHVVKVISEAQASSETKKKAATAAVEKKVPGTFVPGFKARLSELKEDHDTECKTVKHASFWKSYVHE